MSCIELTLPFQKSGKILFHLSLSQYNYIGFWEFDIYSNLPKELIETSYPSIRRRRPKKALTISQAYKLLQQLGDAIIANSISKYFYYPEYLFPNNSEIGDEYVNQLLLYLAGYRLEPGLISSNDHIPELLYQVQNLLFSGYFFFGLEFRRLISSAPKDYFIKYYNGRIDHDLLGNSSVWKFENENLIFAFSVKNRIHLQYFCVIQNKSLN